MIRIAERVVLVCLFFLICGAIITDCFPRFTIGVNHETGEEQWVYDWKEQLYLPVDEFNKDNYRYDYIPADPSCRPVTEPSKTVSTFCKDYKLVSFNKE